MVNKITTKFENAFVGFAESRIGGRAENQDTCAFTDTPLGLLVLVCDGMGGGPGGKTASMIAAKTITNHMQELKPTADAEAELKKAINLANEAIYDFTDKNPQMRGMGSTVAAVLLNDECAVVAHIGDSRVYQLRGRQVVYRSTDHSKVMGLVQSGVLTEEQARLSGESNIITQALGHGKEMKPDVERLPYLKGDRFALCSDGIWGMFPQKELLKMFTEAENPAGAVDNTVINVDETGKSEGGTHDNLTLAIVDMKQNSLYQLPMKKSIKILICTLALIAAISVIINVVLFSKLNNSKPAAETEQTVTGYNVDSIIDSRLDAQRKAYNKRLDSLGAKVKDAEAQNIIKEYTEEAHLVEQLQEILHRLDALEAAKDKNVATKEANQAKAELEKIKGMIKNYPGSEEDVQKAITELGKGMSQDPSKTNFKGQIKAIKGYISKIITTISTN